MIKIKRKSLLNNCILLILCTALQSVFAQNDSIKIARQQATAFLRLYPVLWQQTAAEYRALCYQAFNIAEFRLNEILKKKPQKENLAIITDLDETVLDNSSIQAQIIKEGKEINYAEWLKWTSRPEVPTVPGAVKFLQYAGKNGLTIFYISNRNVAGVQTTLINLKKLKLPNTDTSHMLFLSNTSSKEARRQFVMKNYDVVMLLGDNLNDFMEVFEEKPIDKRLIETDNEEEEWGKKFIVLPNATYGEWENALYDYKEDLSAEQKSIMLKSLLKGLDESQKK